MLEKQRQRERANADRMAEKQLQEEAKQVRIALQKTSRRGNSKKSLMMVLKIRANEYNGI
jgi:hypothetical protein